MKNLSTLTWQFYKPYIYYAFFFNLFGLYLVLGKTAALILALFAKLISYAGIIFYQHQFDQNSYYYYRNSGRQLRIIYTYAFVADFALFILLITISLIF